MRDEKGKFIKGHNGKPPSRLGIKHTKETKLKMSISRKGKYTDKDSWNWKGENVKYQGLHIWIRKNLGNAYKCIKCNGTRGSKKYEWANKNHKYKRNLKDWMQMCRKCHFEYDNVPQKAWKTRKLNQLKYPDGIKIKML